MKIVWSPLSLERVDEIAAYIAQDHIHAAVRWIEHVFGKVEKAGKWPLSGRIVPETDRPDIREVIYGNYRIIYRYSRKSLFVLTVRHCKQILPIEEILE